MNLFIWSGEAGFHTAPKKMEEGEPSQDQVRTTKKDEAEADGQFYYWFSCNISCAIVFAYHYQIPLFPLDA